MTDHDAFDDLPDDETLPEAELASLGPLLGDEAVWEEPAPGLEDAVVAAIRRASGRAPRSITGIEGIDQVTLDREPTGPAIGAERSGAAEVVALRPRGRRWVGPLLGAAAALLVVAGFSIGSRLLETEQTPDHLVAMAGTELAPGASAVADVVATPLGTRIILDVTGLPPAPEGQYYEAWLRQSAEIGVSAGTFHLRGGDGSIELWAGVAIEDYPLVTVTLQDEGAGAASSGQVVLKGSIDP